MSPAKGVFDSASNADTVRGKVLRQRRKHGYRSQGAFSTTHKTRIPPVGRVADDTENAVNWEGFPGFQSFFT